MRKLVPMSVRLLRRSRRMPNGCLEWAGSTYKNGYGEITLVGGNKSYVHREAWKEFKGPIPKGLWVLHTCDNRKCFEKKHLYLGTVVENARDMVERGRHGSLVHPEALRRGEQHPIAKLTDEKARQIRLMYSCGPYSMRQLSVKFNISLKTVLNIVQERIWNHVRLAA